MIRQESTWAIRDTTLKTSVTLHTLTLPQAGERTARIVSGHSCVVPSEQTTPSKLTHSSTSILCHPRTNTSDSHQAPEQRSRQAVKPSTRPTRHLSHCTKHSQSTGNIAETAAAVCYLLVRGILLQLLKDPDK